MAYTVFLSYCKKDRDLADDIYNVLKSLGTEVYRYDRDPTIDDTLPKKLKNKIENCDALIALLTKASAGSAAVNEEIGVAMANEKFILPLLEEGVDFSQFTLLQGKEYLLFNKKDFSKTMLKMSGKVTYVKKKKLIISICFFAAVAAFLLWTFRDKKSK